MKGYEDLVKLLKQTQATGGLDISTEAICEYQDMIAHSHDDQLEELANGNLKESFYRVYGYAYGTVEAIRFHCRHGRKIIEMISENDSLKADVEDLRVEVQKARETAEKFRDSWEDVAQKAAQQENEFKRQAAEQENEIKRQAAEIITLKAKLYDMMQAGQ